MGLSSDDLQGGLKKGNVPVQAPPLSATVGLGPHHVPKTFTEPPGNAVSPNEPPVPVLQKHGFNGGINAFNGRVQTAYDAYQKAYGSPPSAGLVFDLAKSPVHTDDFQHMFTVPLSHFAAKNRGISQEQQYDPMIVAGAKDFANQILHSAFMGNYEQFAKQNALLMTEFSGDKQAAAVVAGAVFKAKRYDLQRQLAVKVNNNEITPIEAMDQLRAAGFLPNVDLEKVHGFAGILATGIGQVADSLVHSPAGMYELGKAAGLDTRDVFLHPASKNQYSHTAPIVKGMAKQTVQDVEHPERNAGYLFLDILGVASPVASGVSRAAEAGRVLSAGEGAGAAVKALATKPLKRATIRYGAFEEEMPLSQNPLVAAAQKYIIDRRQTGADAELAGERTIPGALRSALLPGVAQDFFDSQLSLAKKVGREADARKRIDLVARTTLQRELDAVAGRAVMQARMLSKIPEKIRGGLTRGEQKAIQVLSWDDPDPLAAERAFHQRMIDMGVGDPKDHLRQIADLKLAKRVLDNPSPRFLKALNLTKRVVAETEAMKIQDLGLLPETAEGRVAKAGAALRGEGISGTTQATPYIANGWEGVDELGTNDIVGRGYSYHRTSANQLAGIREHGLLPKPAKADATGVYFGQNPLSARGLSWKTREGSTYVRVKTSSLRDVTERAFGEHFTPHAVPPSDLEYLGADKKWHPVSGADTPKRVSDESFYLKTEPRGKVKRGPSDRAGYFPTKPGPFGVPLPRDLPELTHQFTGKALMAGDYRIDATSLASESFARTVRAVTVRAEHAKLWDAAEPIRRSERWQVPIRDVNTIPDKLREVVAKLDEGDFTEAEAKSLPSDMRDLVAELYPDATKLTPEEIQNVRWIDRRLLGEGATMPHVPGLGAKVAQAVNSPFRFTALYLRPAYILNKLGNQAMLLFDEGIHTVPNYIKALSSKSLIGEENLRTVRELVGAGKSKSYVAGASGKVSKAVAEFWNNVADRDERVTSFIHYAKLKGYKWNQEDITRLLNDPASRGDLVEVTRRANKALVEFDNLLPIEKDYIRHWIFVYPWVSRSAVWSIRAILEHPTKTAILSHLGREDMADDPIFKAAPDWFKRIGYVPVGWNHDGTPRVINPTSINTFSTIGDFVAMTRGATVGDKYASAEDFLGPLPKYFVHAATGRDEFGNQYPGSQWWDAAKDVLISLPQLSAYQKAHPKKKNTTGPALDITNRSSLESSLNANLKKTVMSPGWLDGYGSLLAGGLSPRSVNPDALAARYWADQSPKVRHQRELDLLNRALDIQAQALGQPVSKEVRQAVSSQANIDFAYKNFLKQTGRAPTDKERATFTVKYLSEHGFITTAEATKANKQLDGAVEPADINRIKNSLLDVYAGGKDLRQWDRDVRTVASFTPEIFNEKVGTLFSQGLADQRKYNVSQDKLYDYGRKYVAFTHEAEKLRKSGASAIELKAFADAHDKPVDGLPSFVRLSWANQTADDQKAHIASIVTQGWSTLSGFDKTLLGRPSDPKITAGWATLNKIIDEQRQALAREGHTFPSGYGRTLAKYVEKYYDAPGLVKDYDFSKLPAYQRLKYLAPIQKSPNHNLWTQLLSVAGAYSKYLHVTDDSGAKAYSATQVRQMWRDYLGSAGFKAWLGEHPDFKTEVANYGKNTLVGLIG